MKLRFFAACESMRVARALSAQAHESLNPYIKYLNSAKKGAARRQELSRCGWEVVAADRSISLRPLDSLVELTIDDIVYVVRGCSNPDVNVPIFSGAQFRPFLPRRVQLRDGAVHVWFGEKLPENEVHYWMGQACDVALVSPSWPDQIIARRAGGSTARIRSRRAAGQNLRLVVEGQAPDSVTSDTGDGVRFRVVDPADGATRLRDENRETPWTGERLVARADTPTGDMLVADNGVRWSWHEQGVERRRRGGTWIQLLPPENLDGDALMDVRAAYCEDSVREVGVLADNKRQSKVHAGPPALGACSRPDRHRDRRTSRRAQHCRARARRDTAIGRVARRGVVGGAYRNAHLRLLRSVAGE
jgi:hypothetical protein